MSVTTNVPERPAAGLGDRSGQPLAAAMIEAGRNKLLAARGQRDNDEKLKACLKQRAAGRSPAAFGDRGGTWSCQMFLPVPTHFRFATSGPKPSRPKMAQLSN